MSEMKSNDLAIETKDLVKRYNDQVLAVDGIDLAIKSNTIYSLLGPNGAGKTTTLSILTTLLEPTAGSATVCGLDVVRQANEVRRRIGVTFQETVLDDALTGRQALDFHGKLYSQSKAQRQARPVLAAFLDLIEQHLDNDLGLDKDSAFFSGPLQAQQALCHSPEFGVGQALKGLAYDLVFATLSVASCEVIVG